MEVEKSQSRVSSKASSRSKPIKDVDSDDISMGELELLANRKKLNKKSEEISIDVVKKEPSKVSEKSTKKSTIKSSHKKKTVSSSIDTESIERKQRDKRKASKENKNETLRKEKHDLLFKLYQVCDKSSGRWTTKLTMDNTFDEIKSEFTRIKSTIDNEGMVKFCKHGLVMGIKGIEMLNTSYDPLGIDLVGWGEAMSYNMMTTEYDEVLAELCEKYKGAGTMSPEIKLVLMIAMSGAMFSFSKTAAKDPSTLANLMGAFMPKQNAQNTEKQTRNMYPTPQQPPQQQYQQPQAQQSQTSHHYHTQNNHNNQFQENAQQEQLRRQQYYQQQEQAQQYHQFQQQQNVDVASEDSDNVPSRLKGPVFDTPDSLNIENIIKTMKEKSKEKANPKNISTEIEQILNGTDTEDVVRDIPAPKPRGKGRPKKVK